MPVRTTETHAWTVLGCCDGAAFRVFVMGVLSPVAQTTPNRDEHLPLDRSVAPTPSLPGSLCIQAVVMPFATQRAVGKEDAVEPRDSKSAWTLK